MSDRQNNQPRLRYESLWEEYKLLQDKVDRIGAFRFQVKGWLIPLVSAWMVAIYTAHISPWAYILAAIFPLLFWLLEKNHSVHQSAYIRRIYRIETVLKLEAKPPYFGPSPKGTATAKVKARAKARSENRENPSSAEKSTKFTSTTPEKKDRGKQKRNYLAVDPSSPAQAIYLLNLGLKSSKTGKIIHHAHGVFYAGISVIVVLVTIASVWSVQTVSYCFTINTDKRGDSVFSAVSAPAGIENIQKIPDASSSIVPALPRIERPTKTAGTNMVIQKMPEARDPEQSPKAPEHSGDLGPKGILETPDASTSFSASNSKLSRVGLPIQNGTGGVPIQKTLEVRNPERSGKAATLPGHTLDTKVEVNSSSAMVELRSAAGKSVAPKKHSSGVPRVTDPLDTVSTRPPDFKSETRALQDKQEPSAIPPKR